MFYQTCFRTSRPALKEVESDAPNKFRCYSRLREVMDLKLLNCLVYEHSSYIRSLRCTNYQWELYTSSICRNGRNLSKNGHHFVLTWSPRLHVDIRVVSRAFLSWVCTFIGFYDWIEISYSMMCLCNPPTRLDFIKAVYDWLGFARVSRHGIYSLEESVRDTKSSITYENGLASMQEGF